MGTSPDAAARAGILSAVGAYLLWGVLPVYWKLLKSVPPLQILCHRVVWSVVFLALLLGMRREWRKLARSAREGRTLGYYGLAAALLAVNWFTYIWAVNSGRIVESSLGYFINPLVSVLFGVVLLGERLNRPQQIALLVATAGVGYLTWDYGRPPWVALLLATTFGLYGLAKKKAPLGALPGLSLETAALFVPALAWILGGPHAGGSREEPAPWAISALLVGTGVVTALPLLLFAHAAQRVKLSTLGLLQYLAPSCQLLIGVAVYGEPFGPSRAAGFTMIWVALGLYWAATARPPAGRRVP
jgi:chloramphenicol-sensitive protein RarD